MGKRVSIQSEPSITTAYTIDRQGRLFDMFGYPVSPAQFPAGVWLRSADVDITTISGVTVGIEDAMFVEEVTVQSDGTFTFKSRSDADNDLFRMSDG
jgi:hypothetical protein